MKITLNRTRHATIPNTVALSLALLALAGCGNGETAATQVVAKVNGDEISVHQINNAMAQLRNVTPENAEQVRSEILDKLINQQLAIQQAEERKIDRSPEVMVKIDAAKRDILTRAYLNQVVSALPKPREEEAKKFYNEHPELFAQRRIYNLHEIVLENPQISADELRGLVAGKSMEEIASILEQQNMKFSTNSGTRAAEQIALPVLAKLADVKDGETAVVEQPKALLILHVNASQSAPVSEELAMQRIPQYLANEQAKKAITDDLQRLKTEADIEYVTQTAKAETGAGGLAKTPEKAAAKPAAPAAKPGSESDADASAAKGISGL